MTSCDTAITCLYSYVLCWFIFGGHSEVMPVCPVPIQLSHSFTFTTHPLLILLPFSHACSFCVYIQWWANDSAYFDFEYLDSCGRSKEYDSRIGYIAPVLPHITNAMCHSFHAHTSLLSCTNAATPHCYHVPLLSRTTAAIHQYCDASLLSSTIAAMH